MKIIPYDARYRDDMIFMVLQAKDALGRVPRLNEDLLDVPGNYLDRGDGIWLALDERDRVIGCVGFSRIPGTEEAFLHRLYVKASEKRKGIGSALLETAEQEILAAHLGFCPECFNTLARIGESGAWYDCAPRKRTPYADLAIDFGLSSAESSQRICEQAITKLHSLYENIYASLLCLQDCK